MTLSEQNLQKIKLLILEGLREANPDKNLWYDRHETETQQSPPLIHEHFYFKGHVKTPDGRIVAVEPKKITLTMGLHGKE